MDAHGLDEMDNKILTTIIENSAGPGLTTLAHVSESSETIEEVSRFNTRGFHYERHVVVKLQIKPINI
jgi:hypothetical protein